MGLERLGLFFFLKKEASLATQTAEHEEARALQSTGCAERRGSRTQPQNQENHIDSQNKEEQHPARSGGHLEVLVEVEAGSARGRAARKKKPA